SIDVAPASSVELARNPDRYRALPGLSISADGPVHTIQLVSVAPLDELDAPRIALPTASATSVVLVKIIMEQRLGIRPRYQWFEQRVEDPIATGLEAALYIGDDAHREGRRAGVCRYDLGSVWKEWTDLPFVFALWQTPVPPDRDDELRGLARELSASREWSLERLPMLAEIHAASYGWEPSELLDYWRSLSYGWSESLSRGLAEFYRRAAELGEIPRLVQPTFIEPE
ncbi:MAG: futalosine synthase, partial [Gemmatimonadetes bacterium]|nr:menaquinone biosynthesis protein [Gemmatimonadota bacterium]NIT67143.1 menaquinone biosynthesis protein [Gemmatimonadota bacterium]NIW75835.1 futalosine synthase [Gemmatimonadota bacterium]NIY35720.1 futalosine synthase [Gemmatimonadota bacterium]NIY43773.1 futalosine synthase [Gemmatimonadota bacterium]